MEDDIVKNVAISIKLRCDPAIGNMFDRFNAKQQNRSRWDAKRFWISEEGAELRIYLEPNAGVLTTHWRGRIKDLLRMEFARRRDGGC